MPIYEYQCPHCRKKFEEWLKSDDDASTHPCPACGVPSPRIISQSTFILKGGGWYVTEYGSHHAENEASQSSPDTSDTPDSSKDAKDGAGSEASATGMAANGDTSGAAKPEGKAGAKGGPAKDSAKAAPSARAHTPQKNAAKAS